MLNKMIEIMTESPDYPRAKLNKILSSRSGNMLDYEVSLLFGEWALSINMPEEKEYQTEDNLKNWDYIKE